MHYEIERTNNFRFQYSKLELKMKRFVEDAVEKIKENPYELQGKITYLSRKKEGAMYRYRMPGAHLMYIIIEKDDKKSTVVVLSNIKTLR